MGRLAMVLKSFKNTFVTKDSTNGIKPSGVPKTWKFVLNVRNLGRSDIDKFYPY
jgi:hypothetical protein